MLSWLPKPPENFRDRLKTLLAESAPSALLNSLAALATHDLDPTKTRSLSQSATGVLKCLSSDAVEAAGFQRVHVRILAEWTGDHLVAPLIVAGLRRRIIFDVMLGDYGALHQALMSGDDAGPRSHFVVFLLDVSRRLERAQSAGTATESDQWVQAQLADISELARLAVDKWGATPIFHNFIPAHAPLFGNHEFVIGTGALACTRLINAGMLAAARAGKMLLWDLESLAADVGRDRLSDVRLWHQAKMLISPDASGVAMDQLAALMGAAIGRSHKVLVLDLDNTLWGGVIGDDGIDGIRLGPGSGEGEAFVAFQRYAQSLRSRGILLAVASKNTHEICAAAIREHPEMVLKMEDFVCFRANWTNKADNLIEIAKQLSLGLDSLVLFDDSAAERALIRRELPMVAVPEVPVDPAHYIECLARARYFDAISLSAEDVKRNELYRQNEQRSAAIADTRDLSGFLRSLQMKITLRDFNKTDLPRITQLVNKTNQFNLTTRRYAEMDMRAVLDDADAIRLSARLEDKFGDSGLISVVIANRSSCGKGFVIDTWLMSCRVLARNVEHALMKSVVHLARDRGAEFLLGYYRPTPKNKMVETFYADMGFAPHEGVDVTAPGASWWRLDLSGYIEPQIIASVETVA